MIRVSYSRVSSFMTCPKKHYLGYVERLTQKKAPRPLQFGSDFHKLLEHRFSKKAIQQALAEIQEVYDNLPPTIQVDLGDSYVDDLKTILSDYRKVYKGAEKPVKLEQRFEQPIFKFGGEPVVFVGILDEIYEDYTLGEHKTFNRAPDMSILAMNQQVLLYSKAHELFEGNKLKRVRWDYIKSTPAEYPIWLEKSGRFSEAKANAITPFSWLRACKERGLDDEETLAKAEKYRPNISNFFFRVDFELQARAVEMCWTHYIEAVKHLIKYGEKYQTMNISRDCSWCNYRPICFAELTGADVDYVKKTDFTYRPKEEEKDNVESDD